MKSDYTENLRMITRAFADEAFKTFLAVRNIFILMAGGRDD